MRVLRSSLLVGAAAFFAAACGDKVNVVQPTNTLKIESVQVSPSSSTISIGQATTLTAAINADAGVTTSVAWSTSSSASATVSQGGTTTTVTGVAASPGVSVCATVSGTATGATIANVISCGTVIVNPANTVVPAVIQIASITVAGNLNAPVPVPPAFVGGQINVSVNVNPGTEKMDSVVVLVNNIPAATQIFTSAQAAALRSAAPYDNQALQSTLVFSVNTAAYSTAGCATFVAPCGKVTFANGASAISVVGYGHQGASAAVNTVSSSVNLLFFNADGWIVTQTLGAGANTAANAAGFNYSGGQTASVAVTSVPVAYSGLTIASASVNYGTVGCDASPGAVQRTLAMTAPVAPSLAWTATFPRAAQTAAKITAGVGVDVNNYSFNPVACAAANAAGGEGANMAAALYTTNTTAPVGFALGSTVPVVRLDNLAPGAPSMVQNPNGRQNGWINATVALTGSSAALSATSNNWTVAGAADLGVGGYTTMLRVAAPSATGTVSAAIAATASATPTLPAPGLTNLTYCAVASATDKLGNESTLPAAAAVCTVPVAGPGAALAVTTPTSEVFGVDIAAPTIAFSGGLLAGSSGTNAATGGSVAALGQFQVAVLDTGAVGNSGMLAGAPVSGTVTIHSAAAGLTALQQCPVGVVAAGVCTAGGGVAAGFAAPAFPLVATALTGANSNIIGYYTYTAVAVDAAGNSSASVTRTVAYNPAANVPTVSGSIFNSPLNGPTATFTATGASGNTTVNSATTFFDLWQSKFNLTYSAAVAGPLLYPPQPFNTFNNAVLVNTNVPVTITIPFIRQAQAQTSTCAAALAVGATGIPNGLNETLVDQAGLVSAVAATPIIAAQVTPGVSYLGAPAAQQTFTFIESNGIAEQPTAGGCPLAVPANVQKKVSGGGTSPDAASITLTADVWGPTATYTAPFTTVNFYVFVGGNMEQIASVSTFTATDDGSANGRKFSYSFAWTPGSKTPISLAAWAAQSSATCAIGATNAQLYAVGISAAGDALVTPLNQNVCISTAP